MLPLALLALVAAGSAPACPAPLVHTHDNPRLPREFVEGSRWIAPQPKRLHAVMWAGRAVDGRFSIYAGGKNPVTGIHEKIMWVVPARSTHLSSSGLRIVWRRDGRRYVQRREGRVRSNSFRRLENPEIYPSILEPPDPGCWKLRLRTGRIKASMHVIVQAPPTS